MLDPARVFALCSPLLQIERKGFCVCLQNGTASVADPVGGLHPWFEWRAGGGLAHILRVTQPVTPTRLHTVLEWDAVRNASCAQTRSHAYRCSSAAGEEVLNLHRIEARRCNTYRVDLYE